MKSVLVLGLDESIRPERNRFSRSDEYTFITQGIPALALNVGFETGSPAAEIDGR